MEDLNVRRSVTFNGMRPSHTYTKLAQRHMEKWIQSQQNQQLPKKQSSYQIHIDKEGQDYFTCHIEVRLGAREWSGIDEGQSVQNAILSALRSLKPKERVELHRQPFFSTAEQISA